MNDTQLDIERKIRLHEFFKSDPQLWQDLMAEIENEYRNEMSKIKSRDYGNRDWSAGYISSHDSLINLERYFKKVWTPPINQEQKQK